MNRSKKLLLLAIAATLALAAMTYPNDPATMPDGVVGQPYSFQFDQDWARSVFTYTWGGGDISQSPYTYGPLLWSGPNPGGLTIAADGTVSGTPLTAGNFNASIGIADAVYMGDLDSHHFLSFNIPFHIAAAPPPPPVSWLGQATQGINTVW